jgi:hypothetical protein
MLGHFDLFGLAGVLVFAGLFYVYPMLQIRLPYFRRYVLLLLVLSLTGGHLLTNSHTMPIFVFLLLFARSYSAGARGGAAPPRRPAALQPAAA